MLKLLSFVSATVFLLGIARADTIKTFVLDAQLSYGASYADASTLDGSFTLDVDTGTVLSVDFDFPGRLPGSFRNDPYVYTIAGETIVNTSFGGYNGVTPYGITIGIPLATLVGYTGGQICSLTKPCTLNSSFDLPLGFEDHVTQGSLSLAPEPSSLVFLATGMVALIALPAVRSRFA